MAKVESSLLDLGYLDHLAYQQTILHRLDPRVKLLTTMVFIVVVVSFDKYEVKRLLPFLLYPVVCVAIGNLPVGYLFKKLLLALPFAFFIGIFNPLLDREILVRLGPLGISGGWISFASILIRFVLTVSAALILIAGTGFNAVCMALQRMKVPSGFAVQLLLLYRYLFVLMEEGSRMARARALRSFGGQGMGMKVFAHMLGQLLLRTLDRAQRIHSAMLCRGFDGTIRINHRLEIGAGDLVFMVGWSFLFILMRLYDLPQGLGAGVLELIR